MTRRRWTISTTITGHRRDVDLFIYDDSRTLRAAAARWINSAPRHASIDLAETAAIVHGFRKVRVGRGGEEVEHPLVAIIRLERNNLGPLIVSHEVAHAAQHIYGLDHDDGQRVAEHMHAGNEDFAHLYGELFAAVWGCVTAYQETP